MNENFVDKINDIVFDTLARRCSVYIEPIGSLVLSSENVLTKVNGKLNSYPYYKVTLVRGERFGIDLKAHALSIGGVDKKNLDAVFNRWLDECGINASLSRFTINGVVAYSDGVVKMSDGLNKSLNPLYVEPQVKGGKSKNSTKGRTIAITVVVSLVVIALAGYFIIYRDANSEIFSQKTDVAVVQEPVEVSVTEADVVESDTLKELVVVEVEKEEPVVIEPEADAEVFYIIAGVFSTKENAEKWCSKMKNTTTEIMERYGKYYVTIGKYNNEQEAIDANRKYPKNDYWVLKIK